jgi:homoserine dehydrogenase
MKKTINLGIVGFGTVGLGVYNLVGQNSRTIYAKTGIKINVKTICDLDTAKVNCAATGTTVTSRWQDITEDPEIDVVAELIGGISPAREIIKESMKQGKNVITANKKLLAENGSEIFGMLTDSGGSLGFEAAVCGGVPCIMVLNKGLAGNNIVSITGILNGTTNYILSKMEHSGLSFEQALADAQRLGFAEADPTFDVEGHDAGHKITILAMLAYGQSIDFKTVPLEGISRISPLDISYANDMGYTIKLLGIAKNINGKLDIRVHPAMIPNEHPLAAVRNEFNSIMMDGDMTGPVVMNGRGAGSSATASAVVSDIVQLANKPGFHPRFTGAAKLISPEQRVSRYYIRMLSEDSPGILSQISGALGRHKISIASVIQKEVNAELVPIIILTHEAKDSSMQKCVAEIEKFDFVKEPLTLIRVEDFKQQEKKQ